MLRYSSACVMRGEGGNLDIAILVNEQILGLEIATITRFFTFQVRKNFSHRYMRSRE